MSMNLSSSIRNILRFFVILIIRPYIVRELPGWGKLYAFFMLSRKCAWLWEDPLAKTIRGKLHGYLMDLDLSRWSDKMTFFLGRWHQIEIQLFLLDMVKPEDTVVDIGANRGMFSLIASRLVGEEGKVLSFEPNPICYEVLDKCIAANEIKNITVNRFGLADKLGKLTLTVPYHNWGEGTFGKSSYHDGNTYQVQADVKVGDDILKNEIPAFIKIDVEGFENNVIAGLSLTLEQHHPVLITEVVSKHLEACGNSVQELMELIEGHGYTGYTLSKKKQGFKYDWELVRFNLNESAFDAIWLHPDALLKYQSILKDHGINQP